jgi:hypothetical protein
MYDGGFNAINGFGLFRANQTGTEHWIRITTDKFLEQLDEHLDTALREYDALFKLTLTTLSKLYLDEMNRDEFVSYMKVRYPFDGHGPEKSYGPIWTPEQRDKEMQRLIGRCGYLLDTYVAMGEFGDTFTIDKFIDWRSLDREALQALARESFGDLEREHRHMKERLAITFNRARDTEGYWTVGRPSDEMARTLETMFWQWPVRPKDDETPED